MSELDQAHIRAQEQLRTATVTAIATAWRQLPSYNETNVPDFTTRAAQIILAAQRYAATLTNAFLGRATGQGPLALNLGELTGPAVRAGTDPIDVYRRPFVTVWTDLKAGKDWDTAVESGLARAQSTAAMDTQLAMRATARDVLQRTPGVVGYRRVPDGNACLLCLLASTQRYRRDDLLPIHNYCGCGIAPIIGDRDPGKVIDPDLLLELKRSGAAGDFSLQKGAARAEQRAEDNRARALATTGARRARLLARADQQDALATSLRARRAQMQADKDGITVDVADHGELGPVLVNATHDFSTLV